MDEWGSEDNPPDWLLFRENCVNVAALFDSAEECRSDINRVEGTSLSAVVRDESVRAAVKGADRDAARSAVDICSSKSGTKLPLDFGAATEQGLQAEVPGDLGDPRPWLEALSQAVTPRLPPEARITLHYHVNVQNVHILSCHGRDVDEGTDLRMRWGIALDVTLPGPTGPIWLERSHAATLPHLSLPDVPGLISRLGLPEDLTETWRDRCQPRSPRYGTVTVVLAPKASALFFHEAVGHTLESEPGQTGALHRSGERLTSEPVSVFDDPTLQGGFGSRSIDDRGRPSARISLVENGRVAGLLDSGLRPCVRLEDFRHRGAARMSNTVVQAWSEPSAALSDGGCVICIERLAEGFLDRKRGRLCFYAFESREFINGLPGSYLVPFALEAYAPHVLGLLEAVGGDAQTVSSFCSGSSGRVPVSATAPAVRIINLTARPLNGNERQVFGLPPV